MLFTNKLLSRHAVIRCKSVKLYQWSVTGKEKQSVGFIYNELQRLGEKMRYWYRNISNLRQHAIPNLAIQGPCKSGSVGNIISCCISKWWNLILVIHVPRCYCTLGFVAGQHSHMSSPYLGSFWYLFRIYCSDERAVMHVGIAYPQWRKTRSLHSWCMRNPQFYVSGRRPMTGIQRVI